jgi:hypothetical protein
VVRGQAQREQGGGEREKRMRERERRERNEEEKEELTASVCRLWKRESVITGGCMAEDSPTFFE